MPYISEIIFEGTFWLNIFWAAYSREYRTKYWVGEKVFGVFFLIDGVVKMPNTFSPAQY